jgi:hypothetical protein
MYKLCCQWTSKCICNKMQSDPLDFDAIRFSNLIDSKYKEVSYGSLLALILTENISTTVTNEYLA